MTSLGLMGTVGEAGLLHFRGAYHNPAMYLPVTMPPMAAALLGASALGPTNTRKPLTRWWLRFTALLGFLGSGFHAVGVARKSGRLAELATESVQWPAHSGAAELHGPCFGGAGGARIVGGSPR